MKKQSYDIIYSLGSDCACAKYMKMANLRSYSGPFDWISNAEFKIRFELMLNNFKDFFNFEDFKYISAENNLTDFDKYQNTKTGFYYVHDFPKNIPLKDSFEAVKQKYNRRINRFYKKITEGKKILLMYFSQTIDASDDEILFYCNKFCKKMNKNIDFVFIQYNKECQNEVIEKKLSENIVIYNYDMHIYDENGLKLLMGKQEMILPVYKKYKLRTPWYYLFSTILFKVFISLIPDKRLRSKLRNKFIFQ